MPLCVPAWLLHQAEPHRAVRIRHVHPRGHRGVHLFQHVLGAEGPQQVLVHGLDQRLLRDYYP